LTFDGGYQPRWSPDGRLIAYVSESGVSVIPSEGGEPRRLTDSGGFPTWSIDSQTIYFMDSDERAGIWSVSLSGGDPKRLVLFDDPTRQPYGDWWSTDGEHFYFSLVEFEADVWVMELEDSTK
jgi:Tol biopolymer transport system component